VFGAGWHPCWHVVEGSSLARYLFGDGSVGGSSVAQLVHSGTEIVLEQIGGVLQLNSGFAL
jgi:hypothetical protein